MTRQHDHTTPAHRGSTRGSAPRRLGAMALAVALAWSGSARADSARTMVRRGNDAYAAGRYEEAMKAYDQADVESPESPVVAFNRGAALYRTGDVAAAREAFSEAARRSRDPAFEAQCRYNIGNGWFQEARRQKDSDLAKAIEACEHSVDNYQAALVLEPEMAAAQRNIEVVRRLWKSILDEQKRRQEEQQERQRQQEAVAEKLRELVAKQRQAADRSQNLARQQDAQGATQAVQEQARKQAEDQRRLGQETEDVTKALETRPNASADPTAPAAPPHPAAEHLRQARQQQEQAVERLEHDAPRPAGDSQTRAAEELQQALEKLTEKKEGEKDKDGEKGKGDKQQDKDGDKGGQGDRQQDKDQDKDGDKGGQGDRQQDNDHDKEGDKGAQGDKQQDNDHDKEGNKGGETQGQGAEQERNGETPGEAPAAQAGDGDGQDQEQQAKAARLAEQAARDILDNEKRQRDRRTAAEQRRLQPVDKDW